MQRKGGTDRENVLSDVHILSLHSAQQKLTYYSSNWPGKSVLSGSQLHNLEGKVWSEKVSLQIMKFYNCLDCKNFW